MQVWGCASICNYAGRAKRKRTHHLAEQLHSGPRQPLYQLQRSARRAPALGDQHLPCLPWRLGAESRRSWPQWSWNRRAGARWAVALAVRLPPAVRRTVAAFSLFFFFFWEETAAWHGQECKQQAKSFFFFDTSSKPNLVMGWIGKFSVHAEREGRPVSFPSKSSMGHAGLNARRRDKQRKLAKS